MSALQGRARRACAIIHDHDFCNGAGCVIASLPTLHLVCIAAHVLFIGFAQDTDGNVREVEIVPAFLPPKVQLSVRRAAHDVPERVAVIGVQREQKFVRDRKQVAVEGQVKPSAGPGRRLGAVELCGRINVAEGAVGKKPSVCEESREERAPDQRYRVAMADGGVDRDLMAPQEPQDDGRDQRLDPPRPPQACGWQERAGSGCVPLQLDQEAAPRLPRHRPEPADRCPACRT